jgi:O-antigen ligase
VRKATFALMIAAIVTGVLTIWVQDAWSNLIVEIMGFAAALIWAIALLARGSDPILAFPLIPTSGIVLLAAVQLWAGFTIYRWKTEMALLYWAANLAWFFVACQVFADHRLRRRFLTTAIVFGALLAVVATLQSYTSGSEIFWLFHNSASLEMASIMGPFLNRNHYAAFAELLLPAAMYRALLDRRVGVAYAVAAGVLYASVTASASRAGGLLATAEMIAVPLILWRRNVITARLVVPAIGSLLAATAVLVFAAGYDSLVGRLNLADQYSGRREFLVSSLAISKDHLLTGTGLGTWSTIYPAYAIFDSGTFVNQAHNDWVQWLAEGGIPMAILTLAIAVWAIPKAWQSVWGIGVIAVLLHSCVDYPLLRAPMAALFFVLLGALENTGEREGPLPAND